ncbi:hypothetical protein V8B55DRAFT_1333881 [Mucor lusitanicus]|uniref:BZIP domain-containing protein n=1 Tax=Mucor circinelloides f. lusitanicus TaxID=29924 RepID=A0A8H4BKA8_MUCCL|nr:hypothetical protein FB192DRAFT_1369109 [Mucor lusitanicus]
MQIANISWLLPPVHTKRELDKDEETSSTAPKRAGRKPLDKSQISDAPLDPKQKRKAQNRAAQRAFRDRKEKHVAELQARIAELEALNATKDEDLVKENEQLKEMLQKLQEENYALKGAQFTFEFPVNDSTQTNAFAHANSNNSNNSNTATAITDMNHRSSSDKSSMYHTTTSGSSMSSNNSYSGEDVGSSAEQSPLSNSHTHEDDSTSADTPINSVFSAEPMQFGLIHQQQQPLLQAQQPPMNNSLDFFAVSDNAGFGTQQANNFPTGDLFHGKDDLFANYRVPTTNNANDDFLFANEDLSGLFGGTDDLFGFGSSSQLNMAAQFGLPETPANRRLNLTADKKEMLVSKLKQGQQEGKYIYQVHQDIKQQCPDFNLDLLCDELKKKATCTMNTFQLTDHDVDAFVKCLDRV